MALLGPKHRYPDHMLPAQVDDIHPFYTDLLNVLYDRDHFKLALGQLHMARTLIGRVSQGEGRHAVPLLSTNTVTCMLHPALEGSRCAWKPPAVQHVQHSALQPDGAAIEQHAAASMLDSCSGCADYVRLLKYGDSLYRCKQLKRAALVSTLAACVPSRHPLCSCRQAAAAASSLQPVPAGQVQPGLSHDLLSTGSDGAWPSCTMSSQRCSQSCICT